jgi:hypothetical protein
MTDPMTGLATVEPWDEGPPRINGPRLLGSRPAWPTRFKLD